MHKTFDIAKTFGLLINIKKTKVLVKNIDLTTETILYGTLLKVVEYFQCLVHG